MFRRLRHGIFLYSSRSLAVYRYLFRPFGLNIFGSSGDGSQPVSETRLFPGDVVHIKRKKTACYALASGFMRARNGGDGSFIEVVASANASDGIAMVRRNTLGGRGSLEEWQSNWFSVRPS